MIAKTVLIVDDDLSLCDNLKDILQDEGYKPFSAVTCADGLKLAQKQRPEVALLDLKLPDGQGTALLSDLKRLYSDCLCIIMTAYADLDSAVVAVQKAAYHYLQKPVHPDELLRVLEGAFETIRLRELKRQAEEALQKNEALLRDFLDNANDLILIVKPDGRFLYNNNRWLDVLGYTADEAVCLSISDTIHSDSLAHYSEIFQRILAGEAVERIETVFVTKDGRKVYVEGSINCRFENGKPVNTRGIFRDITERKRAEQEREHASIFMQTVIDGIPDEVMVINRDYTIALANRTVREMSEGKDLLAARLKCHQVTHKSATPCSGTEHLCPMKQVIATKAPMTVEHIHYDNEGCVLSVEVVAAPIIDKDGEVVQIIESIRDITYRKHAERDLEESEERFRNIFDNANDLIQCVKPDGTFLYVNPAWQKALGYVKSFPA